MGWADENYFDQGGGQRPLTKQSSESSHRSRRRQAQYESFIIIIDVDIIKVAIIMTMIKIQIRLLPILSCLLRRAPGLPWIAADSQPHDGVRPPHPRWSRSQPRHSGPACQGPPTPSPGQCRHLTPSPNCHPRPTSPFSQCHHPASPPTLSQPAWVQPHHCLPTVLLLDLSNPVEALPNET